VRRLSFKNQPTIQVNIVSINADVRPQVRRFIAASAGVVMTLSISSATADSVEDMCHKSSEECACAAKQLKSEVGDDDYALYEAVGAAYIANQASGMGMGEAWDAAVKAESSQRGWRFREALSKTNAIGKAHRKAIEACAG
jgi:hypothetical protein